MIRRLLPLVVAVVGLLITAPIPAASAQPAPGIDLPFIPDCKGEPVPSTPDHGLAAFFSSPPEHLPEPGDPFKPGSKTTIFEQYGYAGIHFDNYDLGCGPDAMRDPGAVIGTEVANWILQLPVALTALTGSITKVAFRPDFLGVFDPVLTKVSAALHDSLFVAWLPLVLAVLGGFIVFRARRAALATSTAAVGWALLVVLLATALFRWPIQAGHIVDDTVTGTLGTAVSTLDGHHGDMDPGTVVASQIESAVLYRAWLAGTLGSADSATAKKYGPALFDAHALTWRQARAIQRDPDMADSIIDAKQDQWKRVASQIADSDPEAYEYLTGKHSEARVGYAVMAALATCLALPFLLLSALLLLGCFMVVRLAVMMFPAFATLGAFPAARGLVLGLGRTVGAAVVNSIIFGVGAAITIMILGFLFAPGHGTPGWLGLILMPLFTVVMWMALRPFRRLTHMVSPHQDHFRTMSGALGDAARGKGRLLKRAAVTAAGVYTGNVAAAATAGATDEEDDKDPPERAEARPTPPPSQPTELMLASPADPSPGDDRERNDAPAPPPAGTAQRSDQPTPDDDFRPTPRGEAAPMAPTEPEWVDGEEVYPIYRPDDEDVRDGAA